MLSGVELAEQLAERKPALADLGDGRVHNLLAAVCGSGRFWTGTLPYAA